MRLLYAFPEPLPLPRARGVQVVHAVHALAAEVDALDFAFEAANGSPDPFPAYGLTKPANVHLLPVSRRLPSPFHRLRVHSNWMFAARLLRIVAASAPDVVFVRHVKMAAALGRRLGHVPVAYEAHEVFADTARGRNAARMARIEAAAMANACLVVANSGATSDRLRQLYPAAAAEVLPNGVAVPDTAAPRDWSKASREVIYAGSFFAWKGVDDLVAAAAFLPGYRITLIGGDADAVARLRSIAPPDGAELVFAGHLPHAEVRRRLADACIAVLPNRADRDSAFTSPLKLFEYLAAGCAVVATDLPAVREVVGDDDVVWAEAGNPADIAAAIRRLAEHPQEAQARASSGFARVRECSWQARARRLAGLLSERCTRGTHG